jgi:hypothetical protein
MARLAVAETLTVYAWASLPNHFHLLVCQERRTRWCGVWRRGSGSQRVEHQQVRAVQPTTLLPFHVSSAFHSIRFVNSPTSAVCVSATSSALRSVMAAETRYCRMASSASARTSRPCFSARLRSSSSTPPGKSMLMRVVYPPESSTSTSTVGRQSSAIGKPSALRSSQFSCYEKTCFRITTLLL